MLRLHWPQAVIRIEDFSAPASQRQDILALTARIRVSSRVPIRPELNFDANDPDSVAVRLVNGSYAQHQVAIYTGAPGRDLDRDGFVAKFEECYRYYLEAGGHHDSTPAAVVEAVDSLPKAPELSYFFAALAQD